VPVLEVLLGDADVELLIAGGLVDLNLPVERAAAFQLALGAQNVDRAWEDSVGAELGQPTAGCCAGTLTDKAREGKKKKKKKKKWYRAWKTCGP
jgi:hypothetical protein